MSVGASLEKRAGSGLKALLGKLTTGKMAGFLTGLGVTGVIQSSSATTVMVVGFVNSGLMTLKQAINVIMGANVGTTVTAWLLSLTGIQGDNLVVQMLKPSSFTPILALIGIVFYMGSKSSKLKDTGMILLGFATLMFGMDAMSAAVSGLQDVPEFRNILVMFSHPILGVLVKRHSDRHHSVLLRLGGYSAGPFLHPARSPSALRSPSSWARTSAPA